MVVIPKLPHKKYCPVRCLLHYINHRNAVITNQTVSNNLPLLLTEHLWNQGSYRADKTQPSFYTKNRFSRDTTAAIKMLAAHNPAISNVTATLKNHSLRAGIPTALQQFKNLPESLQQSIGKFT